MDPKLIGWLIATGVLFVLIMLFGAWMSTKKVGEYLKMIKVAFRHSIGCLIGMFIMPLGILALIALYSAITRVDITPWWNSTPTIEVNHAPTSTTAPTTAPTPTITPTPAIVTPTTEGALIQQGDSDHIAIGALPNNSARSPLSSAPISSLIL